MPKYVYRFSEGDKDQKDLLGGKGANLAEMTRLDLPVPPGFTITTDACRAYLASGEVPDELSVQVTTALRGVEEELGRELGAAEDPLLVSVRSGAKFSMPGMMETVLNIGLNDVSVKGLAAASSDERFAWDSYRRLIQMFGKTVLDIDGDHFSDALEAKKDARGVSMDYELPVDALQELVEEYKAIVKEHAGIDFPQDPRSQLDMATEAVFRSWNTERAHIYRRREKIPHDLGTAVNVCTMVFGNMGETSGTGVCFTRDPSTGRTGVYGDYLVNAQGEDVVAGIRNTLSLADLERLDKASYDELRSIMRRLETHYRDLCDIEFTIERGKLWMLQTRVGKRTAAQLAKQGVETGADLLRLLPRRYDTWGELTDMRTLVEGEQATIQAQVVRASSRRTRSGRVPALMEATVTDGASTMDLVQFGAAGQMRARAAQLAPGTTVLLSGKVGLHRGCKQLSNPRLYVLDELDEDEREALLARPMPIYPGTEALPSWLVAKAVRSVLDQVVQP